MPATMVRTAEPGLEPLPAELDGLLTLFFAARRTANLYEPHHPIATEARAAVCSALTSYLGTRDSITLSSLEGELRIDGVTYRQTPDTRSLARRMRARGIHTIILHQRVDQTELLALFSLLSQDPTRVRMKGGPAQAIANAGVTTTIEISELADHILRAPASAAIEEELPPEASGRQEDRRGLVDYLMGTADQLKACEYDLLREELQSPSRLRELIAEAVVDAHDAEPDATRSDLARSAVKRLENAIITRSPEQWEQVKTSVRHAVSLLPPAIRPRIFQLEVTASPGKQEGTATTVPHSAMLDQRAANILNQIAEAVTRSAHRFTAPSLALTDQYSVVEQSEEGTAEVDLSSLFEKLSALHPPERAAKEELQDLFASLQPEAVPTEVTNVLCELLQAETRLDAYSEISAELEERIRQLLGGEHRELSLWALATLAQHAAGRGVRPPGQEVRASAALHAIGPEAIAAFLTTVLRTATPEEAYQAGNLIALLGVPAVPPMVRLLSEPLPPHSESALCTALAQIGAEGVPELSKAVSSDEPSAVLAALRILMQIPGPEALRAMELGLQAPNHAIRLATVQSLGRVGNNESATLLCHALGDSEPAVRQAAADALGRLRHLPALKRLAHIAANSALRPEEVLAERVVAISALGQIGGAQAGAHLASILSRSTWFRRAANDQVRIAAATALGRIGDGTAAELLRRFAADRRVAVRNACEVALDSLREDSTPVPQS